MSEHHDKPFAGHLGQRKTLHNVSRDYWWPTLRADVEKYVGTCPHCQANKSPNYKPFGLMQPLEPAGLPWTDIQVDFVSGLPLSNSGNDSCLVVIDRFTKMFHVIACNKNVTAVQFADMFLENIFRIHGLPNSIVSDRDKLFTSNFWKEFTESVAIRLRLTSGYHP